MPQPESSGKPAAAGGWLGLPAIAATVFASAEMREEATSSEPGAAPVLSLYGSSVISLDSVTSAAISEPAMGGATDGGKQRDVTVYATATASEPTRKAEDALSAASRSRDILDSRHSAYTVLGLSPMCTAQEIESARRKLTSFWGGAAVATDGRDAYAAPVCERIEQCADALSTPARRLAYDLENGFSQALPRARFIPLSLRAALV